MPVNAVLGLQWGDEGKGKVVDLINPSISARCQGGPNAGHTVQYDGHKIVLHQIPSLVFSDEGLCVVGNGAVIDLKKFKQEIDDVIAAGREDILNRLYISDQAHIIFPQHIEEDKSGYGKQKIGSTGSGIGYVYRDKMLRTGMRLGMGIVNRKKERDKFFNKLPPEHREAFHFFQPYLTDTRILLHKHLREGKNILLEGAQAFGLDIDHGTYPFVTSSNTTIGGLLAGSGLPNAERRYGVFKAYNTRVGEGPFPTHMKPELDEVIRQKGKEFGATTGRPRKCGWIDLPQLRSAIQVNGITDLAMTKLDVLSGLDNIQVCTGYKYKNKTIHYFPTDTDLVERVTPIYTSFPSWDDSIRNCRIFSDLPETAKSFVSFIKNDLIEYTGFPLQYSVISVGPDREETIHV